MNIIRRFIIFGCNVVLRLKALYELGLEKQGFNFGSDFNVFEGGDLGYEGGSFRA